MDGHDLVGYCGPLKRTTRENRYAPIVAVPLPNCSTEENRWNPIQWVFLWVWRFLSDYQGSQFRNKLMTNMRLLIGYNHVFSTPYHPQTNRIVERFNTIFVPQLSELYNSESNDWDEYLETVVFAYNSGIHKTINYSPYELLYNSRHPRLPFDSEPSHFSFS